MSRCIKYKPNFVSADHKHTYQEDKLAVERSEGGKTHTYMFR